MDASHYKIRSQDPNISIFAVNKHIADNLQFISKSSNIVFKQQINIGKFGFLFHADTPVSKDVAVKIISEDDLGEYELVWQSFNNKCVIRLLQTHLYREINTRLFVMQRAEYTLDIRIRDEDFTKRLDCLDIISSWIDDVTLGIQYIHAKGFAHCSLKKENIFIMEDKRAVLGHFHSLAPVNSFVYCDEIDVLFRPPECFRNGIDRRPIAGSLDIYSLGILAIEAITGDCLGLKLPSRVTCWSTNIYPVLFKMTCNLTKMSKDKYPNTERRNLNSARNFICACLEVDPEQRVKISQLWKHKFVGGVEMFSEDNIWRYKGNKNKLRKKVKNLEIFQDHTTIGYKSIPSESTAKWDNKEKSQKKLNKEECEDKNINSNINFTYELNNTIEDTSLYEEGNASFKQESANMHREPGDTSLNESSVLPEKIRDDTFAHYHYEKSYLCNINSNIGRDISQEKLNYDLSADSHNLKTDLDKIDGDGKSKAYLRKVNDNHFGDSRYKKCDLVSKFDEKANHEASDRKVYEDREKTEGELEMCMLSENRDPCDIKENESENHGLSEIKFVSKKDEIALYEKNCESDINVTLRKLMKYTFRDSLAFKLSHPDNFVNKLSTKLTQPESKRSVMNNTEKGVISERLLDKDYCEMEVKTKVFSGMLKIFPLKIFDILLTHLR